LTLVLATSLIVVCVLAVIGFGPALVERWHRRRARLATEPPPPPYDPGRERRAEVRARELLRSVVSAEEYAMYVELGFIALAGGSGERGYAYLLYPHRPIVAYDADTGELLSEYCVSFPDRSEPTLGERLPGADDVLAKWMSLRAGERELISVANMHVPGRQLDPGQVRRDLVRLREWRAVRSQRHGEALGARVSSKAADPGPSANI
jgi:hypothetical protein